LVENYDRFKDFENPNYDNIRVFKKLLTETNMANNLL
jgi:hypothetical protein